MNGDDDASEADAIGTVRAYYDALRAGQSLGEFFAEDEDLVTFGISERLVGGDSVADGLADQTATTSAWTVDSRDLRVTELDDHALFADDVFMGWTSTDPPIRYEFDTRSSGTLERHGEDGTPDVDGRWRFVGMHVSTAGDL